MSRILLCLLAAALISCQSKPVPDARPATPTAAAAPPASPKVNSRSASKAETDEQSSVLMHNVILHERDLVLRVRWLRARLGPTKPGVVPSFDEPDSFYLDIADAAIAISLTDVAKSLNTGVLRGSALQNIKLSQSGRQMVLNATLHKVLPLPVEVTSDISASPDGRVHIHVTRIRVLKIPVKGLLGAFKVNTGELMDPKGAKGLEVHGDDIYIDPEQVLPSPRKRGTLTDVHLAKGNIVEFYGAARSDVVRVREWRNFLSLRGGALEFGKLSMQHADIMLIDLANDEWFDFDLRNYQSQLVNGYIRMTPQAGLRIFMPDVSKIPPSQRGKSISLEWLKNRNRTPPEP